MEGIARYARKAYNESTVEQKSIRVLAKEALI